MRTSLFSRLALAAILAVSLASTVVAAGIEPPVRGKQYKLTKAHGPWMIMVATISRPPDYRKGEGMSPEEAADELVYELRQNGYPAYTFKRDDQQDEIKTTSRRTNQDISAKVRSQSGGICVLAGNYKSSDDPAGQYWLKQVKKFHPKFMTEVAAETPFIKRLANGGLYRTTPNRPSPLSGAFLTTNPLLSSSEIQDRTHDPLLVQLNGDHVYSLTQNPGKYSVVVATFQGKSQTQITEEIDNTKLKVSESSLHEAGQRALDLCLALRDARKLGYDQDFESYVYHDHYSSVVTVGAFNDPKDPRITTLQNKFGAKVAKVNQDGSPEISAEIFSIPRKPKGKQKITTWIFDPFPRLMNVPK